MTQFKPVVRQARRYQVKASIMIEGLTGSGKTGLALCFAHALADHDWNKVGMIDTENKSADLIVGQTAHTGDKFGEFLKVDLTDDEGYAPTNYLSGAKALVQEGVETVIFDSSTHAWNRRGGILDMVNDVENTSSNRNKFAAWNDPLVVQNRNALFEMIRNNKYHVITTVRVKEKFGMDYDDKGKTLIRSLGEQQVQTEGLKYEPDLVLKMITAGTPDSAPVAQVVKSRYPMLKLDEVYEFTPSILEQVRVFLEEGADPEELLEQQRQEYVKGVVDYCEANPKQKPLWMAIKQAHDHKDTKINDIPLSELKAMYIQLVSGG